MARLLARFITSGVVWFRRTTRCCGDARVCYVQYIYFALVRGVLQLHIIKQLLCDTSTLALADNLGHLGLCSVLTLAPMDAGVCLPVSMSSTVDLPCLPVASRSACGVAYCFVDGVANPAANNCV